MADIQLKPKISIIIPAYNSEKTIIRSLYNLLNQDILECEIVIVNDGSTDNTRDIIQEVIKKDGSNNNIMLIDQDNRGLGGARNTGIKCSTSDYITFLDADDTLDLKVVKEAAEKAEEGNFDIVMFRLERIGQACSFARNMYMLNRIGVQGINDFFCETTSGAAWGRIYNRFFINISKLSFPERRYHEDLPFVSMAYYYARKASYINKVGYSWIFTDGSITSSINMKHIDGMIDSLHDIQKFLICENIYPKTNSNFIIFCCKHINGLFSKIDKLPLEQPKNMLLHYLKARICALNINDYKYYLWKNTHIINFIKNINRVNDL